MKTISRMLWLLVFAFLLGSMPARAQCNPSYDPDCLGGGDDFGPDVGFTPDGGSYTVASGAYQDVSVSITFSDADGLSQSTLKILRWYGGASTPVTGFSWTPNGNGTFALSQGTLRLSQLGETILTAEIADRHGKVGSGRASFRLSNPDPNVPVVSLAPHHNDFRNTALGASVLTYGMPAYVSLDTQRSLGLYYDSQRADPTGFVQLDVETGGTVAAVTLQIVDQATNAAVTSEDAWNRHPSGKQRLGAQWSMRDRPSGAYMFWADVRAYQPDKTTFKLTRVPFRVLVVNDRLSRYGIGWSFAGIQRLFPKSAGIVLDEGNGVARYYEKVSCVPDVSCSFRTPAGDFSKLEYIHSGTPRYVRTYIDGTTVTFNTAGMTTSISDRFGRTTKYDWVVVDSPPVWLLVKVTDPAQINTWFEYYDGYLQWISAPGGRRIDTLFTGGHLTRIAGPTNLDVQYDTAGRTTSYTDARGTWDVAYDERGTVRQLTAPAVVVSTGATVRPATTFRSLQATTVLGSWVTHICCNWAAAVPANAVFITVTDALGHTTQLSLDRYAQATKVIDIAGRTTTTTYNDQGLPTESSDGSHVVAWTWNDRGQLLSKTLNGAVVYHASYTTGDQPEFEMSGGAGTWYSYGPRGEVLRTWYGNKEDAVRNGTSYEYDANYRVIASVGPKGERQEWAYTGNPWQNVSESRMVRTDGTRLVTTMTYDGAGRPLTVTNAQGQATTTNYDALNRPVKVVDPLQRQSLFGYTGLELTSFTDPAGKVYRWAYNALGWVTTETFPDGTTRRYGYNADGQRTSSTDRRNLTVTFHYDSAHRLASRVADGVTATFTYPDLNTVQMTNDVLTETISNHPEAAGRLHKITYTMGVHSYEVEHVLDRMNGWTLLGIDLKRYQSGSLLRTDSIRYTPDFRPADTSLSSAVAVRDFSGRTTTIGFDASGKHARTMFPNGVTQNHWYANDGRLNGTTYNAAAVDLALGAEYTYDLQNRISTRAAMTGDKRWAYGYDALGQLSEYQISQLQTSQWCNPSIETCDRYWEIIGMASYRYDAAGNRTDSGATLQPSSNRYATFNGYTMEYDAEGNLTRKYKAGFDQRLTWNALGRLSSVTTNSVTVTYGYAASGRRVRRTEGGVSTWFIYDDDDLILEIDNAANPVRAYTHLPGTDLPLSVRTTSGGTETAHYYTLEAPGHVTGVLNTSGGVAGQYRYAPFGEVESQNDTTGQPLRYMARELDARTGLYYVRNRWYDPALARWISEDPRGLADGINPYAYVGNDPINYRDPSGLGYWVCRVQGQPSGNSLAPIVCVYYKTFWDYLSEPGSILQMNQPSFFEGIIVGGGQDTGEPSILRPDKPIEEVVEQHIDCFVDALNLELQGGLFVSIRGQAGIMGYDATLDAGSVNIELKNRRFDVFFSRGFYADLSMGGLLVPVGYKESTPFNPNATTTYMRGVGSPELAFDIGAGGGLGVGIEASVDLKRWFPCVVR